MCLVQYWPAPNCAGLVVVAGDATKARQMVLEQQEAFIEARVKEGAIWTLMQVNQLCAISSRFDKNTERKDDALGDGYNDAADFRIEGKKFKDIVVAWHCFKPSSR